MNSYAKFEKLLKLSEVARAINNLDDALKKIIELGINVDEKHIIALVIAKMTPEFWSNLYD